MLALDIPIIPFRRRDKKDVSLSRFTSGPVNLDSNSIRVLLTPTFQIKKREKSQYVKRLLDEILPTLSNKKHQKSSSYNDKNKVILRKRNKSFIQFKKIGTHYTTKLEKIEEINNNKREVNLYRKNCDLKRHQPHNKFITNFLFPLNHYISKEFALNIDDYEVLAKKIQKKGINFPSIPNNKEKQSDLA